MAAVGASICRNPSPLRSSVAFSPAPMPILPTGAEITPETSTTPPSRPTKPPGAVLIVPALLTGADAPVPENFSWPFRKSWFDKPRVEPTKPPPTLTVPLLVMAMPLGLTRKTCPLALIWPAMLEGVEPVTRFSVAEEALGCWKVTLPPCPTEKLFQSIIARPVVCWMVSALFARCVIMAVPAVTEAPFGKVCARAGKALTTAATRATTCAGSEARRIASPSVVWTCQRSSSTPIPK